MGFTTRSAKRREAELTQLMTELGERTIEIVGPLSELEIDGEPLDPELVEWLSRRFVPLLMGASAGLRSRTPDAWEKSLIVQRRYLEAMQEALWEERSIGAYSSGTYSAAQAVLDREERRVNPVG
jgi:CPA1 family monovalent cation:H+ antiporter